MNIGKRIYELRKSKGISQEELAEILNVSRQAISKWENNTSLPELDNIILISDYFEVSTDYILKGINNNKKKAINFNMAIFPTLFNIIGFIIGILGYYQFQHLLPIIICFILQIVSIFYYEMFFNIKDSINTNIISGRYDFYKYNTWIYTFIPIYYLGNKLFYLVINFFINLSSLGNYIYYIKILFTILIYILINILVLNIIKKKDKA